MSSYKNRALSSYISYSKFIQSSLVYKRKTVKVHSKFIKKWLMNFAFFCWNELSMNLKFIKMNLQCTLKFLFFFCWNELFDAKNELCLCKMYMHGGF